MYLFYFVSRIQETLSEGEVQASVIVTLCDTFCATAAWSWVLCCKKINEFINCVCDAQTSNHCINSKESFNFLVPLTGL